jgi:hypothetical protein
MRIAVRTDELAGGGAGAWVYCENQELDTMRLKYADDTSMLLDQAHAKALL